jgi:hypothetical protein
MIPLWKGKNPIYFGVIMSKVKVTVTINRIFLQQDRFRTITLVLYIGSLPNLATRFPCGRGRTLFILGSLPLYRLIIYIDGRILWCTCFLFSYVMTRTSYILMRWWYYIRFVLDQYTELDFYSASSLKQQSTVRYVTLIAYTDTTNLCSNTSLMMHEPTNLCSNTSLMMHEPTNMCSNTSLIMHEPTNLCSNTSLMMHEPTNLCSNTSLMMHA